MLRGMSVHLGDLNKYIAIQELRETYDANGDPVRPEVWTTTDSRWARVETLSASENVEAGRVTADRTLKFTMRYVANMTMANRINWDSRDFAIESVESVDAMNVAHVVIATEIVTGG